MDRRLVAATRDLPIHALTHLLISYVRGYVLTYVLTYLCTTWHMSVVRWSRNVECNAVTNSKLFYPHLARKNDHAAWVPRKLEVAEMLARREERLKAKES